MAHTVMKRGRISKFVLKIEWAGRDESGISDGSDSNFSMNATK
jgi:hypothetical protein